MKFIPLEKRLREVLAEKLSDLNASAFECGPPRERVLNFVVRLKQEEDKQAPAMALSFSVSLQQKLENLAMGIMVSHLIRSLIFF